jgi:hypothetical protein
MFEKRAKKSKLVPTSAKQCIWVDAGVISYRLCPLNYERTYLNVQSLKSSSRNYLLLRGSVTTC